MNNNNITNLSVNIPENNLFIKKLLIHCAREFYKDYILFENDNKRINIKEAFNIILECLKNTIEEFIPVHEIIEQNLVEYKNELSSDESLSDNEFITLLQSINISDGEELTENYIDWTSINDQDKRILRNAFISIIFDSTNNQSTYCSKPCPNDGTCT